jgi:hypothetical protein
MTSTWRISESAAPSVVIGAVPVRDWLTQETETTVAKARPIRRASDENSRFMLPSVGIAYHAYRGNRCCMSPTARAENWMDAIQRPGKSL